MQTTDRRNVAVLLATYNGAQYVRAQIESLAKNSVPFRLHWLDDHSSDETREVVRASARDAGIQLCEWHQSGHLGVPASFFRLLECVEADFYLFCDQDDIWQPERITAIVEDLNTSLSSATLSFTEVLTFEGDHPTELHRPYDLSSGSAISRYLKEGRAYAYMPGCASAQSQGFTRPLRDIVVQHTSIARSHACMHDWWMYDIAMACGTVRALPDAPKVHYRRHQGSYCAALGFRGRSTLKTIWRNMHTMRQVARRHSQGLLLVSTSLTPGPKLTRMIEFSRLATTLDRRQSPVQALKLIRLGFLGSYSSLLMALNLLLTKVEFSAPFELLYRDRTEIRADARVS